MMKFLKKLIKEPVVWFVIPLLILGAILLANFSTKIIYNVKYTTTTSTTIFNKKTKTAVQYNNMDVTERIYYNYIVKDNSVYLYKQSSDSNKHTYQLTIDDKFTLVDEYGNAIKAESAENTFITLRAINGFIAIILVILLLEYLREYIKKKNNKEA